MLSLAGGRLEVDFDTLNSTVIHTHTLKANDTNLYRTLTRALQPATMATVIWKHLGFFWGSGRYFLLLILPRVSVGALPQSKIVNDAGDASTDECGYPDCPTTNDVERHASRSSSTSS
jgi:hypothetical protein